MMDRGSFQHPSSLYPAYDRLLLLSTLVLVVFGALMIYSSTSVITPALAKKGATEFYYFKRHIFTIFVGLCFMFLAYTVKPASLKKIAIPLLLFSFVLLLLVFLPGIGVQVNGARRWIRLWPSTFQPSEFVKLSMVIFLARYLSSQAFRPESFISFVKPLAVMAVFQAVMLIQPDFGAAMSLAFLTITMLFLSGTRLRYLISLSIFALPILFVLIKEPYRLRRVTSFLDPWKDPQGSGFQLVQSFIAFGSGGMSGVGLGSSIQKLSYLPESHTDFIFSIIGEEFGFIGVSVIIALFVVIFFRGFSIANRTQDKFTYYLAVGLSLMISVQALVNFAVATGLVPTKGLPLPFISYGGSSLLMNMAAIGILLKISRGRDYQETETNDVKIKMVARRKAVSARYKIKNEKNEICGIPFKDS
jgi:cell division protein FtsW